jgi:hypothetical protein
MPGNHMTGPTIGEMITKYQEIKAIVEAEQKKFDQEWGPYLAAMKALNAACCAQLVEQKLQNQRNDDGMAFLRRGINAKVDNPTEFLKFVVSQNRWDLLNPDVVKDELEKFIADEDGKFTKDPPPGVTVTLYVACTIRK